MSDFARRLPVYLLLDCSGSMGGEPIEAVREGIRSLVTDLKGDPQALETAYLSVITFSETAQQALPLTELMRFEDPAIEASGTTALGAALKLLRECIEREVRKSSAEQKGDWKPLVFILTDGIPTDAWKEEAQLLRRSNPANIVACAAGAYANTAVLQEITDNVVVMNSLSAGDLARFFAWVSGSIKISSESIDAKPGEVIKLLPPPEGFIIVP